MSTKLYFQNKLDENWTVCVWSGRPAGQVYDWHACVVENNSEAIEHTLAVYQTIVENSGQWNNWYNGPNYQICESNTDAIELMKYRVRGIPGS